MTDRSSGTHGAGCGPTSAGRPPLEVGIERVERWVRGFAARHGEVVRREGDKAIVLTAADGSTATLEPLCPNCRWREFLALWAAQPPSVAFVLVRRGGYAVGLAKGHARGAQAGTRHVQSRTAVGGWSQDRFAAARQPGRRPGRGGGRPRAPASRQCPPGALVVGGDKALTAQVLDDARLAGLRTLPRRGLFDISDPRLSVLQEALRRGRAVRIALAET